MLAKVRQGRVLVLEKPCKIISNNPCNSLVDESVVGIFLGRCSHLPQPSYGLRSCTPSKVMFEQGKSSPLVKMQSKQFTISEEAAHPVGPYGCSPGQHLCRKKDIMWVLTCRTWKRASV